jgi:hypothetical protein
MDFAVMTGEYSGGDHASCFEELLSIHEMSLFYNLYISKKLKT